MFPKPLAHFGLSRRGSCHGHHVKVFALSTPGKPSNATVGNLSSLQRFRHDLGLWKSCPWKERPGSEEAGEMSAPSSLGELRDSLSPCDKPLCLRGRIRLGPCVKRNFMEFTILWREV